MQLVPLEPQVRLDLLVLQGTQALRDRLVLQAPLVQRVQLEIQEPLVLPDQRGPLGQLDLLVQLVQMQRRFQAF